MKRENEYEVDPKNLDVIRFLFRKLRKKTWKLM